MTKQQAEALVQGLWALGKQACSMACRCSMEGPLQGGHHGHHKGGSLVFLPST